MVIAQQRLVVYFTKFASTSKFPLFASFQISLPERTLSQHEKADAIVANHPREFNVVPGGVLMCKLCEVKVSCERAFQYESHRSTKGNFFQIVYSYKHLFVDIGNPTEPAVTRLGT